MLTKGKIIDFDTARKAVDDFDYIYSQEISAIRLFPVKQDLMINWDECIDVRYFNKDKEIQKKKKKDEWKAVLVEDAQGDSVIVRTYSISRKYRESSGGTKIRVKEYLGYDEDGQAYAICTRLAGVE